MGTKYVNQRMLEKLEDGRAIDVSKYPQTKDGDWVLDGLSEASIDGQDLCDGDAQAWIWSVGEALAPARVEMKDGSIRLLAQGTLICSTTSKYYQAEEQGWRCVWLR